MEHSMNVSNITTSQEASPNSLQQILLMGFVVLDGSICIGTVPLSALNLLVIAQTSVLHLNLKAVLLAESLLILARALFRIAWILNNILTTLPLTLFAPIPYAGYSTVTALRNIIGHILIVERILATLFVKCYENYKKPYFILFATLLSSIYAFITAPSEVSAITMLNEAILAGPQATNNISSPVGLTMDSWRRSLLPSLIKNFAIIVLSCIKIVVFYKLLVYNKRKYDEGKRESAPNSFPRQRPSALNRDQSRLSQRYQLTENIRTGRQLLPVIALHLVNMLNSFLFYGIMFANVMDLYFYNTVITSVQLIVSSVINCAIEVIIITSHPNLSRRAGNWFQWALSMLLHCCPRRRDQQLQVAKTLVQSDEREHQRNAGDCGGLELVEVNGEANGQAIMSSGQTLHNSQQLQLVALSGGHPLVVTPRAQADEHFQMLREAWGSGSAVQPFHRWQQPTMEYSSSSARNTLSEGSDQTHQHRVVDARNASGRRSSTF